jgi:polyhydroxybutyrate depolymerase
MKKTIKHDGELREYLVYVPSSMKGDEALPLVFAFHGGGGRTRLFADFTGFDKLAEKRRFLAVYPQGISGYWNDGRIVPNSASPEKEADDVGFVSALVESLEKEYPVDRQRIFAMGMSNGGAFCQRLAIELSHIFAAVASVTAQVPERLAKSFKPEQPISVLLMNGTSDPFVPYSGGEVVVNLFPVLNAFRKPPTRGRVISTDDTIKLWLSHNKITAPPRVEKLRIRIKRTARPSSARNGRI